MAFKKIRRKFTCLELSEVYHALNELLQHRVDGGDLYGAAEVERVRRLAADFLEAASSRCGVPVLTWETVV